MVSVSLCGKVLTTFEYSTQVASCADERTGKTDAVRRSQTCRLRNLQHYDEGPVLTKKQNRKKKAKEKTNEKKERKKRNKKNEEQN